MGKGIS